MIFFTTFLSNFIFFILSFLLFKSYQLCGYKTNIFLTNAYMLKFAIGDKNKIVFTKRFIRFLIMYFTFGYGLFFLINFFIKNIYLVLFNYLLILLLAPFVVCAVHYLLLPLEILIKKVYILRAKSKLKKLSIIKIGITGSYGKTSTKNILKTLLEKEYKVCATPQNYNTDMGVVKTILQDLDDHDIFIAEMGARHEKDIEILTKIVNPKYGIITTIGLQHIETFKNLQTIEETKYELASNLENGGIMIFNGDCKSNQKLFSRFQGEKYLTCDPKGFAQAENIIVNENGSEFDLIINDERIKVKTKLLGKCNIDNIVTAAALAYLLGITKEDMVSAISSLESTPHRLELIKNANLTIIDDSYNSNIVGAKEALDVLDYFQSTKIVVTPGFVEMGSKQSEFNFKLGAMIADKADFILIMNETNKNDLLSGAIAHGLGKDKIFFANSRKRQKEILTMLADKNSVILFENDLPDNYK